MDACPMPPWQRSGQPGDCPTHRHVGSTAKPSLIVQTFGRNPAEAPFARRFVRRTLANHPAREDAELLAAELFANAVLHAGAGETISVAVTSHGRSVHVRVMDEGTAGVPCWFPGGGGGEGGRGLVLVNEIAARWGFVRETGCGTSVWFEIGDPDRP